MCSSVFRVFFFCLLCSGFAFGQTFGERLHALRREDTVVYDFQQSVTLIRVVAVSDDTVELRVATATKDAAEREGLSWLAWADNGCPGASTDEVFKLRINNPPVLLSPEAHGAAWLITLFGLPSAPVSAGSRRKAGPAPMSGEIDLRAPWQPRIIVDGHAVSSPSDAYSFHWPADNSVLSDRMIIAYFPRSGEAVPAFPYWIESPSSSGHAGVIDSRRYVNIFNPKAPSLSTP